MARYGSERIRGHGIPEAIEAILINGSRVEPKVAILKPLSSAISIGSGGPFGAEGPIIMTGGAFGSMIAQFFHLTSAERKTLLVAGAAARHVGDLRRAGGGGAAGGRTAAVRMEAAQPDSGGAGQRDGGRGAALHPRTGAAVPGAAAPGLHRAARACWAAWSRACWPALLSALLTVAVYAAEDAFQHAADSLDVVAGDRRPGDRPRRADLPAGAGRRLRHHRRAAAGRRAAQSDSGGILLVKSVIWAVSLGSGTSGGVLAPLLMMGGALGGLEAMFLPHEGAGFWPLVSMGAILGGTMRSPFTGVIFALS